MDLRAGKPFGRLKGSVGAIRDIAHPTEPLVAVVGLDRYLYLRGKIPPPGARKIPAENSTGDRKIRPGGRGRKMPGESDFLESLMKSDRHLGCNHSPGIFRTLLEFSGGKIPREKAVRPKNTSCAAYRTSIPVRCRVDARPVAAPRDARRPSTRRDRSRTVPVGRLEIGAIGSGGRERANASRRARAPRPRPALNPPDDRAALESVLQTNTRFLTSSGATPNAAPFQKTSPTHHDALGGRLADVAAWPSRCQPGARCGERWWSRGGRSARRNVSARAYSGFAAYVPNAGFRATPKTAPPRPSLATRPPRR